MIITPLVELSVVILYGTTQSDGIWTSCSLKWPIAHIEAIHYIKSAKQHDDIVET